MFVSTTMSKTKRPTQVESPSKRTNRNTTKDRALAFLLELEQVIKDVNDRSDLKCVQRKLKQLSEMVDAKVASLEGVDGLSYKGEGAEKCQCGNTFYYEGPSCGVCDECESDLMCIECLRQCECKSMQFCHACSLNKFCTVCDDKILCLECDSAVECRHCEELVCKGCTMKVRVRGLHKMMCQNCVKYG
jgi:hypothetical protein